MALNCTVELDKFRIFWHEISSEYPIVVIIKIDWLLTELFKNAEVLSIQSVVGVNGKKYQAKHPCVRKLDTHTL